ncbi:MAG: sensor histidine kinase [Fimbriimonadaceae bacterium]
MSIGKRWRGLSHRIRVTVISTVAATVVLGLVLLMTGFLLIKNATDTAMRQTHMVIDARLNADKDRPIGDIVKRINRIRERQLQRAAGINPDSKRENRDRPGPGDGGARRNEGPTVAPPVATKAGASPTPPPRPHMAFAMYNNDGTPFKGVGLPNELTYDGNPVPWPTSLASAQFPATFLHFVKSDPLGRFKVLCLYDATDQIGALQHANLALLVLWPFFVALLGLASYFAVGSSFRPLHKLLTQASTLGLDDRLQTADQAEFGELAASLNSYLDRIEKVVRQQEEFAVDAAHELCTPLTALRGQLELALLQKNDPEAYAEAARSAIAQVTRLGRLVESLLLATRPRDGVVAPVDVQQALEEVQARWVDRYAARHVDLQLSAEAFKAAMPEEELESVMENLLANALKFSPAGTTVRITLDAHGHLVVQDQGPGIPPADRERVFERFERGTTKARGFGIGLYLVRRLLEQRGGAIAIGDSPTGARVEVALPA